MDNQITSYQEPARYLSPVASIEQAVARYALMAEFVKRVLREDHDFGKVPGTDKPTLLKPGAEKLNSLFGLTPVFPGERHNIVLDWTGRDHDGEPFFYHEYTCQLFNGDQLIAEGVGSCNSWEKKYRYRNADRVCPSCGKATIFKSKQKPEFYCWAKRGGCGATFPINDKRITEQEIGQVKNPDPADIVNTVDKMAQKRALIAATLIATNASEYFTQDMEDFAPTGDIVDGTFQPAPAQPSQPVQFTEPAQPIQPPAEPAAEPPVNSKQIDPKLQALIDAQLARDVPDAAGMLNKAKPAPKTPEETIAWGRLYRGWRDIGADPKQAAEKANGGQKPE